MSELRQSELHWLTRRYRGLLIPRVIVDDGLTETSGFYVRPAHDIWLMANGSVSRSRGIIVVNGFCEPCTLAHEYRHHWQWCTGIRFNHTEWELAGTWEESISRFFSASWTERDALRFERKMYPSWFNEQMLDAAPFVACGL